MRTDTTSILEEALEKENMNAAYLAVKANDGSAGVDGRDIQETREHLINHWEGIERKLLSGRYRPAAVRSVSVKKSGGGKRRLGIPTVTDRIIQQALHQVLTPIFDGGFSEHSYGFRPGRSAHGAVRAAQEYVRSGKHWVVDIDLKQFFDQVEHDRLMYFVGQKVKDKQLMKLLGRYLRAPEERKDGSRHARKQGTPQGGPLSPLLANIYLDPLDKELESRGLSFVRYADDIAIFASSERSAQRILESVIKWLAQRLKLEVNREKSGAGRSSDSSLLGFRLYETGSIGVSPKAVKGLKEKVRECWDARQGKTSRELRDQWQRMIRGWWNYFKLSEWRREVEDLSGWIRRHMRKCFWLRWHGARGRRRALGRLGIRGRALDLSGSSRGAWRMAGHAVMHHALNNRVLQRYGFTLPWSIAEAK